MSKPLSPDVREVFDRPYMAHLATLSADGSPHVTPVAVIVAGDQLHVNCAKRTVKARNMMRDPRVALSVIAPENPWLSGWVQGQVVEITEDGAWELLDQMSDKYERRSTRDRSITRLVFKIEVERGRAAGL
jgi:PPOX class probable F420-dependent enzyme